MLLFLAAAAIVMSEVEARIVREEPRDVTS